MNKKGGSLTTNLVGGLGNQLFLMANLIATARRNENMQAWIDRAQFSSSCNEPRPTYWNGIFSGLQGVIDDKPPRSAALAMSDENLVVIPETRPVEKIQLSPAQQEQHCMLGGFFQSARFFDDYHQEITQQFYPQELHQAARSSLDSHLRKQQQQQQHDGHHAQSPTTGAQVSLNNVHTVALHVRRDDYLEMRDTFEILDHRYYEAAVSMLLGNLAGTFLTNPATARAPTATTASSLSLPAISVVIFSQDKAYAKTLCGYLRCRHSNLQCSVFHPNNGSEVHEEAEKSKKKFTQEEIELIAMSCCNDIVMANSSFSWWSAYLNQRPRRRVVAPSKWFVKDKWPRAAHIYCKDWILI